VPAPACTITIAVRGLASEAANASTVSLAGLGMVGGERARLLRRAVVDRDRVAVAAGEVAGEVRAHHGEADDPDVRDGRRTAVAHRFPFMAVLQPMVPGFAPGRPSADATRDAGSMKQ
jgi:hypothetical protein